MTSHSILRSSRNAWDLLLPHSQETKSGDENSLAVVAAAHRAFNVPLLASAAKR